MIDEGLIDTKTKRWSDEWTKSLNEGKLASLTIGAWMVSMLDDQAPDQSGNWRVANTPTFGSTKSNGEDGGSTLAIMSSSKKQAAAWKFLDFAAHGDGVKIRVDNGQFPADKASLSDSSFLDKTDPYFGDQKFNEVLSQAADDVNTDWQFLPYDVHARSIFPDTAGQAVLGKYSVMDGLKAWQDKLVEYGKDQGYTVNQ